MNTSLTAANAATQPTRRRLPLGKRLLFALVAGGVLYGMTESAALVILFFTGESWHRVDIQRQNAAEQDPYQPGGNNALPVMLHPYIGYVLQPGENGERRRLGNNLWVTDDGFIDDKRPIHKRSPERVIVGIVGGSVARQLSMTATDVLAEELAKHPELSGREFTFVRMAIDGHKQPQQLMAVSYYLSQRAGFDIIINLDGVNEAALPESDNVPMGVTASFPRNWGTFAAPWSSQKISRQVGYVTHVRVRQQQRAVLFGRSPLRWSPLAQLIWKSLNETTNRHLLAESKSITAASLRERSPASAGPPETFASQEELYAHSIDIWAKSSEMLGRVCASQGVRYYHFLQPNQYVPESKPISSEEQREAFNLGSAFRKAVMTCFPKMQERGRQLAAEGIQFRDLTRVFADHPEQIYRDDCCHVNKSGDEIMARTIAREIVASWDESGKSLLPQQPPASGQ